MRRGREGGERERAAAENRGEGARVCVCGRGKTKSVSGSFCKIDKNIEFSLL